MADPEGHRWRLADELHFRLDEPTPGYRNAMRTLSGQIPRLPPETVLTASGVMRDYHFPAAAAQYALEDLAGTGMLTRECEARVQEGEHVHTSRARDPWPLLRPSLACDSCHAPFSVGEDEIFVSYRTQKASGEVSE
ncbi:MAG: hypothetical protein HY369_04130 [Candidatus Aenigmarchaeota archaeon]|nr:hypothetical protein [Candidatus Aenigmarchaeota archaeon]